MNKNRINILFVMIQMGMGGSERLIHNLVLKLDREFFNPSIAWFFGDEMLKEFEDLKVPLYHIPKMQRIDFAAMENIRKVIKDNDIHIVNAHHFMSMVYSFYGSKISKNAKIIYTEHSKSDILPTSLKWKLMGRYLVNHLDGVVGVSKGVTEEIKRVFKLQDSKSFTILNGVDIGTFEATNQKIDLLSELALSSKEKVIGCVANFKKVKNHILLLRAFKGILKEDNCVKLILVGRGFQDDNENSEAMILDFIKRENMETNVLLLGYREDIPDLLNIMDIFCLTSFNEGLPISLLEAMSSGIPLVGTNVEGIRDVVVHNKNGFLISDSDVTGLKRALCTLLKNKSLRENMGRESRRLAREIYSLDRCVSQYQELFLSVMNQ